jgi:hypothetical protein
VRDAYPAGPGTGTRATRCDTSFTGFPVASSGNPPMPQRHWASPEHAVRQQHKLSGHHRTLPSTTSNCLQPLHSPPHCNPSSPPLAPPPSVICCTLAGTWTRLPDYDSSSSGGRHPSAVDAGAAAALASQRLEGSGWPPILTRALSGRVLLKMHAGPANPQGVAGVEVGRQKCQILSWRGTADADSSRLLCLV